MIYGVAILVLCMFTGSLVGNLLGLLIGLNSDVGGVGFAMLLLLLITNSKKITDRLPQGYSKGLDFWKEMFIPVTIAMAASQNVYQAISGGVVALVVGVAVVFGAFFLFMLLNRIKVKEPDETSKVEVES